MIKEYTDFVDTNTGEVLYTIDKFLDILICPDDAKQAIAIATGLVGSSAGYHNKPIMVVSVYDYGDGTTSSAADTFEHLLKYGKNKD